MVQVEVEAFTRKNKNRGNREEQGGGGAATVRSKGDEYREISDWIGFDNLRAMMEAEAFMRKTKKKRVQNNTNVDFGYQETDAAKEKEIPIVLITSSEEERDKRKGIRRTISKLDEYKKISDLSGFPNLKAMIEAEASMWRKKRSSKKKRSKMSRNFVFYAHKEFTEHAAKEKGQVGKDETVNIVEVSNDESVQISEMDVPQNLIEEEDAGTVEVVETTMVLGAGDVVNSVEVINSCSSSPKDDAATISIAILRRGVEGTLLKRTDANGMRKKRRRKKIKSITEKHVVDDDARKENGIKDNVVLQMLLRKPRYFDPPIFDWALCTTCGKENHTAANCKEQKQDKPCFHCGFEHIWRFCKQGYYFVREGRNDLGNNLISNICLRCGDRGHDMFSCRVNYQADDLKAIQCYVCKNFGHLCCINFPDLGRKQVSCYKCGQSGHMGSECTMSHRVPCDAKSYIYDAKCRKKGH